jgi:hypothetical protein
MGEALRMSSAVASSPQWGRQLAAVDASAETLANLRTRTSFAACPLEHAPEMGQGRLCWPRRPNVGPPLIADAPLHCGELTN